MMRAGVFVYAKALDRVAEFYAVVLDLAMVHRTEQMVVLRSADLELLVHAIPPAIAATIEITTPPQLRDDAAIKFFAMVASLDTAGAAARAHGGDLFGETWQGPGFTVRNAFDPEGNIFQVRQPSM
ncbi:MAG: hypothetical protein MUF40_02795 [Gemmatimonadaceae bacterium]|jgi:predicted enzyme related to lactoylglutathione lyase|nr:hypothetical protein [Gemmatimonadaceae bacterium]